MFQAKKEGGKKYIGERFQENVCKTNIKSTTSSAKIAKQSAQILEVGAQRQKHENFNIWMQICSGLYIYCKGYCWMFSVGLIHCN